MEFLGVQYGNINDLPKVINNKSKAILFADDTSIIISNPNAINLKKYIINIFEQMNVWFTSTFLSLILIKPIIYNSGLKIAPQWIQKLLILQLHNFWVL